MSKIYTLLLAVLITFSVNAAKTKKVLIIGIDGCRPDAMMQAYTPNIDILMDNSTYSLDALTQPPTWSANGWSSLLTGVWGDKHGATDGNSFGHTHFDKYPDIFKFIEDYDKNLNTSSMVVWNPINDKIVEHADFEQNFDDDKAMANAVAKRIKTSNDDVMFIHFDDVDHAGHSFGFNPKVKQYMEAIEKTDTYIGKILAGLRSRTTYSEEEWLIIVTPDHGGNMAGHGGTSFEERNIFFILSGNTIKNKEIKKEEKKIPIDAVGVKIDKKNHDYFKAGEGGSEKPFDFGEGKDFTIELRVKTSGWDSDPVLIGDGDWNHGYIKGFIIYADGDSWGANIGDGQKRVKVSSSGPAIKDNNWHNLSVSFDRDGNMTLYQDGQKVGAKSIVDIKTTKSENPLVIGQDGTTTYGQHFDGYISEVRIWNKVISAENINKYFGKGIENNNPNYDSLQAYWKMDEKTGNEVKDSKGDIDLTHKGTDMNITWNKESSFIIVDDFSNTPRIVDIAATVLDFLGIDKPEHYEGKSRLEKTTFVPKKPIANFGAEKTDIFKGESVLFYDESGYNPTSYSWEFEGGVPATSTEKNPVVKYDNEGEYKVKLTVTNAQGTDTKELVKYIMVKAPYEVHKEPIIDFTFEGDAENMAGDDFSSSTVEKVTFEND